MFRADDATLALLKARWQTGDHIGQNMPFAKAWVRTGKMRRAFRTVTPDQVYCHIPGLGMGANKVWQGRWEAAADYRELPNLIEVELTTDFTQNGVTQAIINMDTLGMIEEEAVGVAGIYHRIERGHYAPLRGYKPPGRAAVGERNSWFDMLRDKSTEIVIVAGYGEDSAIPIFKGLLNDDSLTSLPDRATITARDFGQLLTDQPTFSNAKVQKVPDPITFADRLRADNADPVRGGVAASSHEPGHPPSFAVDESAGTSWRSQAHDNPGHTEWIEMALPAGRYETIRFAPDHPDLKCYVALKTASGWVDEDNGTIPDSGGVPWIKRIEKVKAKFATYELPVGGYEVGDDARLRLYFTNLARTYDHRDRHVGHRASVRDFAALKRTLPTEAKENRWILVDDSADVVKTVLQWCGLDREWEIEDTGVRLTDKLVFNRSDRLIDIINRIAEMTNYVFFLKPPSQFADGDLTPDNPNNQSLGTPVFRQNQAMRSPGRLLEGRMAEVTEDDLLTGIEPTFSDEPLAYNIRVRGRRLKAKKGGLPLGGEETKRAMYVYRPPWSRDIDPGGNWPNNAATNQHRNGNVKKYVVHHDNLLRDSEDCEIAALFIAFREALESAKATCEFPAMPTIHLDQQVSIRDTGTGLSTRLWITNRTLNITLGESAKFKMAVGGSILDTPDADRVIEELSHALRKKGYDPGLSSWELKHHGDAYVVGENR